MTEIIRGKEKHMENMLSRYVRLHGTKSGLEPRDPVSDGDISTWVTGNSDDLLYNIRLFVNLKGKKQFVYGKGKTPKDAARMLVRNLNNIILAK